MNTVPVIFEDHNLARMRPLSWSVPVFELRCGMFNTRERVDLCPGADGGVLLGRSLLGGLNRASGWRWGSAAVLDHEGRDDRFLFLNGMLAPDFQLVQGLLELAGDSPDFVWRRGPDLMAALVGGDLARRTARQWDQWECENERQGIWADPALTCAPWVAEGLLADSYVQTAGDGDEIRVAGDISGDPARAVVARLEQLVKLQAGGPRWVWDIVSCTAGALAGDLSFVGAGLEYRREPFGIFPATDGSVPDWARTSRLATLPDRLDADAVSRLAVADPRQVFCGEGVDLAPGTALDTAAGPVILDRGVKVMPHCFLQGPLYIGSGSLVKPGARIHGESSFGIVNRLAGEIGESTFGDFANKQHSGFIGHAVLGSWTNLGAMTTCSDLKNNYGQIRVDLGAGATPTGSRFVGLMMGDHAKTAIGTLFNTGTCVGFASNIFGSGMPPKFVGNFSWGGQAGCPRYEVEPARGTAAIVMDRRGCLFTAAHEELFNRLG